MIPCLHIVVSLILTFTHTKLTSVQNMKKKTQFSEGFV